MSIVRRMLHTVLASRTLICYLAAPSSGISSKAFDVVLLIHSRGLTVRLCFIADNILDRWAKYMALAIDALALTSMLSLIEGRHEHIVQAIRRLVETESPSGDVQGSRAVN